MDKLLKKFNDGMDELRTRAKHRVLLVDIERMYGYCLGIAAAMQAVDHPRYPECRAQCDLFLDPKRTKDYLTDIGIDWVAAVFPKPLVDYTDFSLNEDLVSSPALKDPYLMERDAKD